jgi:guanylate kinase
VKKGLLVVVSAASGAGKSTLCRLLLKRRRTLKLSVSVTTRRPRAGEVEGRHYFFVSHNAFKSMRDRGEFVEWADVHGEFYGTPKRFLESTRRAGNDVLLEIDVQGAMQVRRKYPESILVFITTPTFAELERRLRTRHSETEAQIQKRLKNARAELRLMPRYDYAVVNDRIPLALKALDAILTAEALKIHKSRKEK